MCSPVPAYSRVNPLLQRKVAMSAIGECGGGRDGEWPAGSAYVWVEPTQEYR